LQPTDAPLNDLTRLALFAAEASELFDTGRDLPRLIADVTWVHYLAAAGDADAYRKYDLAAFVKVLSDSMLIVARRYPLETAEGRGKLCDLMRCASGLVRRELARVTDGAPSADDRPQAVTP
jgi:hypothetical protein